MASNTDVQRVLRVYLRLLFLSTNQKCSQKLVNTGKHINY